MYSRALYGVLQRSVLGPTLFTNDLPSYVKCESVYTFSDNTTIYCRNKSADKAMAQLNRDELLQWSLNNKLTPHPNKTARDHATLSKKSPGSSSSDYPRKLGDYLGDY